MFYIFVKLIYLLIIFNNVFGLERLWLIRHCDKPKGISNPCCSELGYHRAKSWHLYFTKYFNQNNIIEIYSSNYNEKKTCSIDIIGYKSEHSCQKSQRMFLTAYYIQEKMQKNKLNMNKKINLKYCVGEKNKLLDTILNNKYATDSLIVWEHTEIIKIIKDFGIKITKWHNKRINEYNIVFLIDIKKKQLYYDCFDFINNKTSCSKNVNLWLNKYPIVDLYYTNMQQINLLVTSYYLYIFFSIIYTLIICITYCIYSIIRVRIRTSRRQNYIEIK